MNLDDFPLDRCPVSRNAALGRYELSVDGEIASFADYHERGDVVVFPHTVTVPRHRGNGLADRVVRFALDDVRERGKRVVPACSFVAGFINTHPEYADLLAE